MYRKLVSNNIFIIFLCILLLAAGISIRQQQMRPAPRRVYHIGIISGASIFDSAIAAFQAELASLGYVEGENLRYSVTFAEGDAAIMAQAAQQYVEADVDLIFTTTNAAALAAKDATQASDIPVLFTFVVAPVETELVKSKRYPASNLTGIENPVAEYAPKRLELLTLIDPSVKRIFVPCNPTYPTAIPVLQALRVAADSLGLELVVLPVVEPSEIRNYLAENDLDPPFEAIFIMPDLTIQLSEVWQALLTFSQKHRLPVLANTRAQVEDGALYSYLADNQTTGQDTARLAKLLLEGVSPADISIESAEVQLVFNLKAAGMLGLSVSDTLLERAHLILR